jgi:hypothetical protein
MDISHHESMCPPSSLLMHMTSSQGDKSSSPSEKMKETSAPPLLDAPLLHIKCSLSEMKAKTPWIYSSYKLQETRASSSISQWFYSNPHQVRPLPPWEMGPPLFSKTHKWRMNLNNTLYPLFSLIWPTLKDQWPRLDLTKSNQWVRSHPKISLWKPTFLSCFMSINSPTLWINCHFMT